MLERHQYPHESSSHVGSISGLPGEIRDFHVSSQNNIWKPERNNSVEKVTERWISTENNSCCLVFYCENLIWNIITWNAHRASCSKMINRWPSVNVEEWCPHTRTHTLGFLTSLWSMVIKTQLPGSSLVWLNFWQREGINSGNLSHAPTHVKPQ